MQKFSKPTKSGKKDCSFYNSVSLKHPFLFVSLSKLSIVNYIPASQAKIYWLYKFSRKHIFGWCREEHTTPFLDTQELDYRSTGKANICIFLHIPVRKYLFQSWRKVLSGVCEKEEKGDWGRWIISLKWIAKYSEIQLYFSILILSSIALKRWNFPNSLNFKGKIVAKFLIKVIFS